MYTVYEIDESMNELNSKELGQIAYKKVKEMILNKQLKPGQKIVQDKLALHLGISRTPLRSALQMLEAEYLVQSIPRRGVIVRAFTNDKVVEIYDCRIALESTAVRRFTEIASSDKVAKLKEFFNPFLNGKNAKNTDLYQKSDMKFHDFLIQNSGNHFLSELFQQSNLLICINQIGLIRPLEETLPEHLEIIRAIEDKDANHAVHLAKQHLLKSRALIIKKIQSES